VVEGAGGSLAAMKTTARIVAAATAAGLIGAGAAALTLPAGGQADVSEPAAVVTATPTAVPQSPAAGTVLPDPTPTASPRVKLRGDGSVDDDRVPGSSTTSSSSGVKLRGDGTVDDNGADDGFDDHGGGDDSGHGRGRGRGRGGDDD